MDVSTIARRHSMPAPASNMSAWPAFLVVLCVSLCYSPKAVPHDSYSGTQHWSNATHHRTLSVQTVASTRFARCQVHEVGLPDGGIIRDWLYCDERDHINVLVRTKADRKFVIFRQYKYNIDGETLAPVGGFIEDGETPLAAAKRELHEELGLRSHAWRSLGSFATSANRGGGLFHAFFADACVPSSHTEWIASTHPRKGDLESQRELRVSRSELADMVLNGRFKEVKWSAVVSLTLLALDDRNAA